MNRRLFAAGLTALIAVAPCGARAQLTARSGIALGPSAPGESVKYTIVMDFRVSDNPSLPPPSTQDVLFTMVDSKHMTLSTGQGAGAETAVADRGTDGRLHAKLKRGSLLYWPMQIFNKLESVTSVAAQTDPGEVRSGPIPLAESDDSIPGSLRLLSSTNATTDVSVEAAGSAAPRDVPRGAVTGTLPPPPDDSSKTGGGLTGGNGQQKAKPSGPVEGAASYRLRATYTGGVLTRAESLEQIVLAGSPAVTIARHWTIAKT